MRRHQLLILVSLTFVLLAGFVTLQQSQAQTTEGLCLPIVRQALDAVGNNCSSFNRNSACYGYDDVVAAFVETVSSGSFSEPNDSEELASFERIETQPFDSERDTWGIALMNVQANLPDTFPGQNVVFMLLGDSEMENAVEPGTAFESNVLVPVTTQSGSDLFAQPSMESSLLSIVPPGVTLEADATSVDGQWVRVTFRDTPGWLMRTVLNVPAEPALPVFDPETSRTPMQAFYFRTGLGQIDCQQAPDTLVVQGPRGIAVDITANGADIQLGSTILLRTLPYDNETLEELFSDYRGIEQVAAFMQVTVLDGKAIINPYGDEEDQIVVEEGYTTVTCLSDPRNLGLDGERNDQRVIFGCNWTPPREVEEEELAAFTELEGVVLNYPIELPVIDEPVFTVPRNTLPTATSTPTTPPTSEPTAQPTSAPTDAPTNTPTNAPTNTPTNTPTFTPTTVLCPPSSVFTVANGDVARLTAAIDAANREDCFPGADTITLAANGTYILDAVNNTTSGPNGLPVITSSITINANGSSIARNIVSGTAALESAAAPPFRLFYVASGGSLTLNNLRSGGGEIAGNGGNILNDGTLTLNNSSITFGSANNGAAIYNTGSLTLNNSSLNIFPSGIIGSSLYNVGALTAVNSTLSYDPTSSGTNLYNAGTASLSFTTVFGTGTGSLSLFNAGTVNLKNSLIAGTGGATSCSGSALNSVSGNLSSDGTCSGVPASSSLLIDPTLQANGSNTTVSHALLSGSSAINAVTDCTTLTGASVNSDQRGAARPFGTACDSGAYESQSAPPEAVDIELQKSYGDATLFFPGDLVSYTVVVSNNGPSTATNVVIRDAVPLGTAYETHNVTLGTYDPGTGDWAVGTLNSGEGAVLTLEVTITATTSGFVVSNTAFLFGVDQVDTNPGNSSATADLTVSLPPVDLIIGKLVDNPAPFPGGTINYQVTVTHNMGVGTTNVVVTDLLPAGLTFVSATPEQGTYNSATGVWTVGAIGVEGSASLNLVATVNASVTPGTVITNTATLTSLDQFDTNAGNNQASAPVTVTAPPTADIAVTKTVDISAPVQGTDVVFTVTVTNNGPDAASGLTISDLLPAGLTYVDSAPSQGTYSNVTGVWNIGALPSASSENMTITATVTGAVGTPITNAAAIATLDQTDSVATNNTGTITIVPVAPSTDIAIFKLVDNAAPLPGGTVVFTIEASNGGSFPATNVVVTDLLPAGLDFVSAVPDQGTYNNVTGVWTVGTITADNFQLLLITATVNGAVAPGTLITNTATLTSLDQTDNNPENDQASVELSVASPPTDIAIGKSADTATPVEGGSVLYTITATNNSTTPATNVVITDQLPGGLSFNGASPSQGTYTEATGVWNVGTIPASGSATLLLGAQVVTEPASVIDNTATLTSLTETDSNAANNQATATVTVIAASADINVGKTVDNASPAQGSNVVFTVTVNNNGPNNATNLVISDLLPSGLTYVTSSTAQGTYTPGTGEWVIGTLITSGTATLSITAQASGPAGAPATNQASVQSVDQGDPTISNNIAFATVVPVSACPTIPNPVTNSAELIAAIERANDELCNPGANTINMNAGTYTLVGIYSDFFGPNALPPISSTITINGNGAVITRSNPIPFRIVTVANSGNLTLNNMTLSNGDATTNGQPGGAIQSNSGPVTLNNVTISGNRAINGGGVGTVGGTININNSTLVSNVATNLGGGIGAISGTVNVVNSTISGNSSQSGGAINSQDSNVTFNFTTMYNNSASFGFGGAVSVTGGSISVRSSLLGASGASICSGTVNDLGGNIADSACSTFTVNPTLDVAGLGSNGGATQTHALGAASPALSLVAPCTDAGGGFVASDQRGTGRSVDSCDAGAFELP
jgi:uncharacterized repeat protein (TIGR01451 family)